jgi:nitrogen fixation protein
VVKLDISGTKVWDRTFGGGTTDGLADLHQTPDGGYLLGGSSSSDAGGDKSQPSQGEADYWIVKIKGDLVALPPHFSAFSPKKDIPGTIVTITGRNLAGLSAVLFNGMASEFEILNDRLVKAKVPAAATSGKVSLVNAGGTVHSNGSFWVRHPSITAFVPSQGRPGSTVLLLGTRLNTVKEVSFDHFPTTDFQVFFDWAMAVVVPEGASTGKIRVVLEGGGRGTSKSEFTIVAPAGPQVIAGVQAAREEMPELDKRSLAAEAPSIGAYPNPFSQQVTFSFTLAQPQPVTVKVYDVLGRELSLLYQGDAQARQVYQLEWRPAGQLPGGLYIIRLQAPDQVIQKRVVLTR